MSQVFPKWTNLIPKVALPVLGLAVFGVCAGYMYYVDNKFWMVGYEPRQPVDYSHQTHAGKLGMDCRYCHTHVEESYHANVPDTATCLNCHTGDESTDQAYVNNDLWKAHKINKNLIAVRQAGKTGEPIQWRRVHKVPDYVNFTHAAHVNAGISCYTCHGRVDQLAIVRQEQPLAMGWCLECHRNPEKFLVDNKGDLGAPVRITDLRQIAGILADQNHAKQGEELARLKQLQPPQNCSACHY